MKSGFLSPWPNAVSMTVGPPPAGQAALSLVGPELVSLAPGFGVQPSRGDKVHLRSKLNHPGERTLYAKIFPELSHCFPVFRGRHSADVLKLPLNGREILDSRYLQ